MEEQIQHISIRVEELEQNAINQMEFYNQFVEQEASQIGQMMRLKSVQRVNNILEIQRFKSKTNVPFCRKYYQTQASLPLVAMLIIQILQVLKKALSKGFEFYYFCIKHVMFCIENNEAEPLIELNFITDYEFDRTLKDSPLFSKKLSENELVFAIKVQFENYVQIENLYQNQENYDSCSSNQPCHNSQAVYEQTYQLNSLEGYLIKSLNKQNQSIDDFLGDLFYYLSLKCQDWVLLHLQPLQVDENSWKDKLEEWLDKRQSYLPESNYGSLEKYLDYQKTKANILENFEVNKENTEEVELFAKIREKKDVSWKFENEDKFNESLMILIILEAISKNDSCPIDQNISEDCSQICLNQIRQKDSQIFSFIQKNKFQKFLYTTIIIFLHVFEDLILTDLTQGSNNYFFSGLNHLLSYKNKDAVSDLVIFTKLLQDKKFQNCLKYTQQLIENSYDFYQKSYQILKFNDNLNNSDEENIQFNKERKEIFIHQKKKEQYSKMIENSQKVQYPIDNKYTEYYAIVNIF